MKRTILSNRRRLSICATSIAAFMAASPESPGVSYDVNLGDTFIEGGVVTGATGLTKTGGGSLVLTNAGNNYTGTTLISDGSVVISAASALGADSSAIVVTGFNPTPTSTNLRGFGGGSLVLNGTGGAIIISRDLSLQGMGPISDRGGALISSGNNTLSGAVSAGVPFSGTALSTRIISADGTLSFTGTLDVGGVAGTTVINLGAVNQGGNSFYNLTGVLTGTGTLEKSGGGTLALDPSNSAGFSGIVRVSASAASAQSVLRINSDGVLGTRTAGGTASVLDMNGGTLAVLMDTPSVTSGGNPANVYGRASSSYFVDHAVGSALQNGNLTLGTLTFEDNNTQTFNGRNGYGFTFGAANVNGGNANSTFTNNLQGGAVLTFNGNFWSNADNGASRTFTLSGNGNTMINGNIVAAAAAFDHNFTKTGTGTLTITGTASTLDGAFNINGGTVAVNSFGAFGASTSAANINIGTGGTAGILAYLGAGETTTRQINLASTSGATRINASGSGPLVVATDLTVNGGAAAKTFTLGGISTLDNEIQGIIPNGGIGATTTVNVTKADEGTWMLSGANTYSGNTTITEGRLKVKANGAGSTVIPDTSDLIFNVDGTDQSAGGTLEFVGQDGVNNVETLDVLNPAQGMGRIRLTPGAGGTASLTFSSLGGVSSLGTSINVIAPTALDIVTITAQPTGFVRGSVYYNGSNFAYSDSGALRAPVYGTDAGFVTSGVALTDANHNEITGNVTLGAAATINSLKINGGQTLDVGANLLTINNGFNTTGGILVTGGNATITGTGGVTQGLGVTGSGGGALVIRVDGASDSLTLDTPITNSTVGGLTKSGLGTLILSEQNNQNGNTDILEGTIQLAAGGRLSPANRNLNIRKIGTLDLNGISTGTSIAAFNGSGTVTNSSGTPAVLTVGNNNGTGTFSGVIQDGASQISVVKQGTGGQTWNSLTGANTYTGPTTINSTGIVTVDLLANIGQPSSLGRGDATSDATNAASLVFGGASATGLSGGISYTGGNVAIDRLFTLAGTAANSGARILANGTNGSGLVFSKTNPIAYTPGAATVAQHLTLGGASAGDNELRLQLVDPAGVPSAHLSVRKIDASTWNLSNTSNSYTGRTTINQGRLVADALSLPATSPLVFTAVNVDLLGGVFHSSGTFTRTVTATPVDGTGTVSFLNSGAVGTGQSGSGGFAASEGKLTVDLGSVTWDSGGFMTAGSAAATLRLNSIIARNEIELVSNINLNGAQRTILVDENTNAGGDFASLSGVLSGIGAGINKTGAGILEIRGANTYTGNTNVTAGTIVVRSLGNSGSPGATSVGDSAAGNTDAGAVTLGNGTTGGAILQYVGPGETSDRKIRLNATTGSTQIHADGTGPLILTNVANDMVDGTKTLFLRGTNAAGNRIDSILANGTTGTLNVTVDGSATWILNAANTYSGITTSGAGALGIANDAALGTSTLVLTNGNVFAHGADRTIANTVNHVNNTTQGFIGDFSLALTNGLTVLATANNFGTNNNLAAGKTLNFNDVTANLLTANRAWTIDGSGETHLGNITSTTAFGVVLTKSGSGTVVLNGTGSNFTQGGANLDIDNGTVRLGANEVIPHGAGFGNVVFTPDNNQNETPTLNLNGFSETINGLTATATSASTIDNASGTAATLTVGAGDGPINFNGTISNSGGGALSLVKTGTAAGIFSGSTITYSGATTVQSGGSLTFTGADPTGTIGITVQGDAGLSVINGVGSNFASLASLNLGTAASTAALGLDVGTVTDKLQIAGAATTAGTVALSIGAAPGFGSSPTYTLLQAASGLSGATYAIDGFVAGGYTYSLTTSDTQVILNVADAAQSFFFWTGDQNGSWATYKSGNTNWEDGSNVDTASTPGFVTPGDGVVVFSSAVNKPAGQAVITTLDLPFTIDSLQFNGNNTSTAAARVAIAPGVGGSLTIQPFVSTDGIEIANDGGIASITAPITLAADQTWTVSSVGALRPELIVTGPLSGTGNLVKAGGGTATVTGNSTRTGRTTIDSGTLRINAEAALGADPGALTANQLELNGGTLRSTAGFTIDDSNRGITITALGGSFDTAGGSITVASSNVITGPGILRKESGNTLILNGANTYGGGTFVNGGAVRAGDNASLSGGLVTLGNSGTVLEVADGVTVSNVISVLDTGNDKTLRLLAGAATGGISGDVTITENTFGNFRVQASGAGVLTVSGALLEGSGTVARGVRINEATGNTGTVIFSDPATSDTYSGTTEIRQGTLMNGADDVIGTSTSATSLVVNASVAASPSATYSTGGFNETVGAITFGANGSSNAAYVNTVTTGAGTLTLGGNVTTNANPGGSQVGTAVLAGNVAMAATRTFTVADATTVETDLLVSAAITGAGGLTKAGAGTLEMTGTNTYGGTTTINAGTLLVNGSISGTVTTAGGTLGGTGSVGAITATTGTVSPGASIGTLTATSLTMTGATLALEINTTNQTTDLINTSGPLSLALGGTPLTVADLGANVALPLGTKFTFLTYNGAQTGLFSFGGNAINDDIDSFLVGANLFAIDYNDNSGSAVSLVVVPEPGIAASLLGGFGMLVGLQRMRRRRTA